MNPDEAVDTINECISDLHTWMINHKLKIVDAKTKFLIIRSQFSKAATPNLTVTVGDTEISSSDKARNLGVIFDSFMNLEPHISPRSVGWPICISVMLERFAIC